MGLSTFICCRLFSWLPRREVIVDPIGSIKQHPRYQHYSEKGYEFSWIGKRCLAEKRQEGWRPFKICHKLFYRHRLTDRNRDLVLVYRKANPKVKN